MEHKRIKSLGDPKVVRKNVNLKRSVRSCLKVSSSVPQRTTAKMGWDAELTVLISVHHVVKNEIEREKAIEDLAKKGGLPKELESSITEMSVPTHFTVPTAISIPFGDYYYLKGNLWYELLNPFHIFQKECCGYPADDYDFTLGFLMDFFKTCVHTNKEDGTTTLQIRDENGDPMEEYESAWEDLAKENTQEELEDFIVNKVLPFKTYLEELNAIKLHWLSKGYYISFKWITSY